MWTECLVGSRARIRHLSMKTWMERLGCGVHRQLFSFDVLQGFVFSDATTCLLGETLGVSFHGESIDPHCQPLMSRELSSRH